MTMNTITLTELCAIIGDALDTGLAPTYWVKAEISSLSERSGHLYLDLVDGKSAKMRATCWANYKEVLAAYFESETGQRLQPGMAVLVEVEIQFHPVYGLSLSITNIDPSYTLGEIAMQRQRTIRQLEQDGLLEAQQLLPLPTLIRRIAVISSANAAGYEDFKHQLDNSGYRFETQLFGATMQGDTAEKSILAALEEISNSEAVLQQSSPTAKRSYNDSGHYDIVVIIRGGGAVTDLSCTITNFFSTVTPYAPSARSSSCPSSAELGTPETCPCWTWWRTKRSRHQPPWPSGSFTEWMNKTTALPTCSSDCNAPENDRYSFAGIASRCSNSD